MLLFVAVLVLLGRPPLHFSNAAAAVAAAAGFCLLQMTFVQATTGGGGWPMSVWLTPELKPIYGGTYYPGDASVVACAAWRCQLDEQRDLAAAFVVLIIVTSCLFSSSISAEQGLRETLEGCMDLFSH
jgi:hypothetical protein